MTETISLTIKQINALKQETRITEVSELSPASNLIVFCEDQLYRTIKFDETNEIVWLDSYPE